MRVQKARLHVCVCPLFAGQLTISVNFFELVWVGDLLLMTLGYGGLTEEVVGGWYGK